MYVKEGKRISSSRKPVILDGLNESIVHTVEERRANPGEERKE